MAITVTSKYKPFTYEELVKPLEGYWDKYDKEEAKLQEELNDLAKLKAIVDTAPEDNVDRQKFDKLYQDFQNSVDILADKGLSIENKNLFRALRQEYSAQIPRILVAEENARKAKQEFMKLQNSGKYITPNNNNPGSFTWVNYLDGNIPAFDPAVSKQEIFTEAAQQAEKVTKRVMYNPIMDDSKLKGYTAITQKQGLKFNTIEEMMANPIMQETYNTIRNSFDTEGWDEASINALDNEIKAGMYKGIFYNEKTDYQKNGLDPSNDPPKLDPYSQMVVNNAIKNRVEHEAGDRTGANITSDGNSIQLTPAGDRVVISNTDDRIIVPYKKNGEADADKQLAAAKSILYTIRPIDSRGEDGWGHAYKGVPEGYYTVNPENVARYLKQVKSDARAYTRIHEPYHDYMIDVLKGQLDKDEKKYEKAAYHKFSSPDEYLAIVVGDLTKANGYGSRFLISVRQLVETLATFDSNYNKVESGLGFIKNLGSIPQQIQNAYGGTKHGRIIDNFNNEVLHVFNKRYLEDFEKQVATTALEDMNKLGALSTIPDEQKKEIYSRRYAAIRDEILNAANPLPGDLYSLFKSYFDTYEKDHPLIDSKAIAAHMSTSEKGNDYFNSNTAVNDANKMLRKAKN